MFVTRIHFLYIQHFGSERVLGGVGRVVGGGCLRLLEQSNRHTKWYGYYDCRQCDAIYKSYVHMYIRDSSTHMCVNKYTNENNLLHARCKKRLYMNTRTRSARGSMNSRVCPRTRASARVRVCACVCSIISKSEIMVQQIMHARPPASVHIASLDLLISTRIACW